MNFQHLILYQFGHAGAIRAVAANRFTVWTGAVLAVTAAVARHYDQTFIRDRPWWPLAPLAFSFCAALLIFAVVWGLCLRRTLTPDGQNHGQQFKVFLGLFWMTSPLAWLYAIPVEWFMESRPAAIANGALLAAVSLWRVLLLPRVLAVLTGAPFLRLLCIVLIPACLELVLVGFATSVSVVDVMGGLTHSPEEAVRLNVSGAAMTVAFWTGLLAVIGAIVTRRAAAKTGLPISVPGRVPWVALAVACIAWVGVAIKPQRELARLSRVERLIHDGQHAASLSYLSAHERSDFGRVHRIPPDPYESSVFRRLPLQFGAMDGREAAWVREEYLHHLEVMLRHHSGHWRLFITNALTVVEALERLPEGPQWVNEHKEQFTPFALLTAGGSPSEHAALTNRLARMGVHLGKESR